MGLVPFRQPSTLFCCCHLVLHIYCCIVENKPSLFSLSHTMVMLFSSKTVTPFQSDFRKKNTQTHKYSVLKELLLLLLYLKIKHYS